MKSKGINLLKLLAGILLMVLNVFIWVNGLFINRERGMDIVTAVPLFVTGAFLILGWYKASGTAPPTRPQRYKFILSALLINYAVMYLIYVVAELIYTPAIDLLTVPGIILPFLLGLFITGFILSWNHEAYAGIFFILWYLLVLYGQLRYGELLHRGPYIFIGIVIFIQGILYLYYHFRIKQKR
ncbi:MAG: hypothetical protein V1903_06295 [Bacteroidota bacterium]